MITNISDVLFLEMKRRIMKKYIEYFDLFEDVCGLVQGIVGGFLFVCSVLAFLHQLILEFIILRHTFSNSTKLMSSFRELHSINETG